MTLRTTCGRRKNLHQDVVSLDHRGYLTDYQLYNNKPKPWMLFLCLHHDFDHTAPIHFILTSYLGIMPSFILKMSVLFYSVCWFLFQGLYVYILPKIFFLYPLWFLPSRYYTNLFSASVSLHMSSLLHMLSMLIWTQHIFPSLTSSHFQSMSPSNCVAFFVLSVSVLFLLPLFTSQELNNFQLSSFPDYYSFSLYLLSSS